MEELLKSLYHLLRDELNSLYSGNIYNLDRISQMNKILLFIRYNEFVDLKPEEFLKLVKRLDYEY